MTNPPDFVKVLNLEDEIVKENGCYFIPVTVFQGALAEKCKVVKAHKSSIDVGDWCEGDKEPNPTHTAFIFGIEPIKPKEPCKHEKVTETYEAVGGHCFNHKYKCEACGANLKKKPVEWEIEG